MKGYVFMALDKIHGINAGFNPFIKPKDKDDPSASQKTGGVGFMHAFRHGKHLAKGLEKQEESGKTVGLSFLKEGALGEEDAIYVKGGRAGGSQNLIA